MIDTRFCFTNSEQNGNIGRRKQPKGKLDEETSPPRRRRPPKVDTERALAMRACARHLKDLRRGPRQPPRTSGQRAQAEVRSPIIERSYCTSPAALCAELAEPADGAESATSRSWPKLGGTGRGTDRAGRAIGGAAQMSSSRKTHQAHAQIAAGTARRGSRAARRDARTARSRQGRRADADPGRRPDAPHARSVRHHARQPAARAARSEAQRHSLAGRRIAAPHP